MTKKFLVCEGAYFPVEGEPPTGVYGHDWDVVEAIDGKSAVAASASGDVDSILSLDEALRAFGK